MPKISILELANSIKKEKGLYDPNDDYSLRKAIRDKMDNTPYLLECHLIENFIINYIRQVADNKKGVYLSRFNKYTYNYNQSETLLKDYYPKSIITQPKEIYNKDSFFIGFTENDGIINRCEISTKYNDSLKIYIEMNFKHLGNMADCFVFTEKELIQVTKCKDILLDITKDIEDYKEKVNKAIDYRINLCYLAKDNNPDYSIFRRIMEMCDALLVIIEKEAELTEQK